MLATFFFRKSDMDMHKGKSKAQMKDWFTACYQYAMEMEGEKENVVIGNIKIKEVRVRQENLGKGLVGRSVIMEHHNGDREYFTFHPSGEIDEAFYWSRPSD